MKQLLHRKALSWAHCSDSFRISHAGEAASIHLKGPFRPHLKFTLHTSCGWARGMAGSGRLCMLPLCVPWFMDQFLPKIKLFEQKSSSIQMQSPVRRRLVWQRHLHPCEEPAREDSHKFPSLYWWSTTALVIYICLIREVSVVSVQSPTRCSGEMPMHGTLQVMK